MARPNQAQKEVTLNQRAEESKETLNQDQLQDNTLAQTHTFKQLKSSQMYTLIQNTRMSFKKVHQLRNTDQMIKF